MKEWKKLLGFRCWLEFNEIYKNTHIWIFVKFYNSFLKNKHKDILEILAGFNSKS
jgi:hypothetical protein